MIVYDIEEEKFRVYDPEKNNEITFPYSKEDAISFFRDAIKKLEECQIDG